MNNAVTWKMGLAKNEENALLKLFNYDYFKSIELFKT